MLNLLHNYLYSVGSFGKQDLLLEAISGQRYQRRADCKPSPEVGASVAGCVDSRPDIPYTMTAVVQVFILAYPGCLFTDHFLQ